MNESVYIFDVDGVINNLTVYEPDARVIAQMVKLLNNDCYISINTGRSYPWVRENLIEPIRKSVAASKLNHLFVSAEMGGIAVTLSEDGEHDERTAFSLLPEQIEQVRRVFKQYEQSKNMRWYEGKISMATIYKPANVDATAFVPEAEVVHTVLKDLFASDHVKFTVNPDALDVTTPEAGKWAGAQLIYAWLQHTCCQLEHFICFGDNASDYEMARFFGRQGHSVQFVFTGTEPGKIVHDPRVLLSKTNKPYSDGAYEFLYKIQEDKS
jgi:HAD superfamily hydrolase (TIGR01484 family)